MMSLYITVVIVMLFPCRCLSQATLFQRSTVVRLGVGSSMELACSVTGAIDASRGWTGGPGSSTLITNGVSTDTSKYTESLQTVDFSLHVHNVVLDDVCGVDYQCYNGFDTSPTVTIVLNSSIFSYVPTGPEIIVQNEVYDTDKKMTILVNLTKVFPEPACTAKLGNKDVTFLSNSYDNGNCGLKSTEISITDETFDCSGNLKIECTVGSNPLTVYDVKPSSCPTVTTEMSPKSSSLDQTSSSQNPSTDTSKTQKTDTNRMSTTENGITSTSLHFTSEHEVTTQMLNRSNNSMKFSVGTVIAIVIFGIIPVCLVVLLVCLYLRGKHTRKQTSETSQPKPRGTNENKNKEQYSRKNVRGQTIPSTYMYSSDYFDSGNPRTKNLNKMYNHKQRHKNEKLNYELSQSMQNNIEDLVEIKNPSTRNHHTEANNRGPSIPLSQFAPEYSRNYRCVSYMLYVDPYEPHAYMYQDYIFYPAYNRVQERQSGQRYYS